MNKLKLHAILAFTLMLSCERKPEFCINGKGYYTETRCVKDSSWEEFGYHYGYNIMSGKFEFHNGIEFKRECIEQVVDTIEIIK